MGTDVVATRSCRRDAGRGRHPPLQRGKLQPVLRRKLAQQQTRLEKPFPPHRALPRRGSRTPRYFIHPPTLHAPTPARYHAASRWLTKLSGKTATLLCAPHVGMSRLLARGLLSKVDDFVDEFGVGRFLACECWLLSPVQIRLVSPGCLRLNPGGWNQQRVFKSLPPHYTFYRSRRASR